MNGMIGSGIRYFVFAALIIIGSGSRTFAQDKKPIRILLIGNSFSQNATRYLPQLAKEGGESLELGHAEPGGCSLQRHWDSVAVSIADSSRGKLYNGKSLRNLLMNGKWDFVTIQQFSLLSGDTATYQPYAEKLVSFIRQYQPGTKILLHQTWPYRSDAKSFGKINGPIRAKDQQEMYEYLNRAYRKASKDLGLRLIPSGDAFSRVNTDQQWKFVKDESFKEDLAIKPALPADKNSLNVGYTWDKEGKIKFDANHASEAGCFLAGAVWYGVIFDKDPSQLKFKPSSVSAEFAAFLKSTAWKVVTENKSK